MSDPSSEVSVRVKGYSDQELRDELTQLGVDVGPIIGTTRSLYERKLVNLLTGTRSEFQVDSPVKPTATPDDLNGSILGTLKSTPPNMSEDSTIHLIRARKPLPRMTVEEAAPPRPKTQPTSPFIAANAQFRQPESAGSMMDHVLKFVLFGVVMVVIVFLISNQDQGNALEHKH